MYGNAGKDIIEVKGGAKVAAVYGDTKTLNDVYEKAYQKSLGKDLDITDEGADEDKITISGAGTIVKSIYGGNGDDIITVKEGARVVVRIQADEGNDKITVTSWLATKQRLKA